MGSPLGPVLANIFVGYYETKILSGMWPEVYDRYVDDIFSHFVNEKACDEFFDVLNGLHPALKFTCEHEDRSLPFMDVRVTRETTGDVNTSIYGKPTFTGLYTTWDSFAQHATRSIWLNAWCTE